MRKFEFKKPSMHYMESVIIVNFFIIQKYYYEALSRYNRC